MSTVTGPKRRRAGAGLVVFALLAALAAGACAKSNVTPRVIYITPKPGPTGTPVPSGPAPAVTPAAATPTITSLLVSSTAPDGRWKVTFKKPVIGGVSEAAAAAMNDAITKQVNDYIDAFTKSDLPAVTKTTVPSSLEGDYAISLNSPTIISLRFSVLTSVSGAAHPIGTPGSISLVAGTGKTIALVDLFSDPAAAAAKIASSTHTSLSSLLDKDLTWDGKAGSLDFFSKAWVFTPAGLEFYWPQGQLASVAAGMPSAVVPWADLKSLLKAGSPAGEFTK
jgi:hypothetical protein